MNIPEVELMNCFHKGDRKAIHLIGKLFFYDVCQLAFLFTGNRMLAEDIVQDCLIVVWQKRLEFDSILSINKFLIVIVRNRSINELKKKGREKVNLNDYASICAIPEINEFNNQPEKIDLIIEGIKTLPPQPRQTLSLNLKRMDS